MKGQIGYIRECKCKPDFEHVDGKGRKVKCVDLKHYLSCPSVLENSDPVPLIVAHALYGSLTAVRYGKTEPVVSVTMLTRCPLTTYYETHTPWVGKVLDNAYMLRGTYAHEGMLAELANNPEWDIEVQREIILDGITVYGTPDAYLNREAKLYDLKTQQEYAVEKKLKATDLQLYQDFWVKENLAQLNCYAVMLREAGLPVHHAELLYMDGKWKTTAGKCRVRVLPVPLQDNEAVRNWMKPRARTMQHVLDDAISVTEIPIKEWTGWKPTTGVDHLVEAERKRRG